MKKVVSAVFLFCLLSYNGISQTWTNEQLVAANTAANISYISSVERDAIMYINLARLYPQQFLTYEVNFYKVPQGMSDYLQGSTYLASLKTELATMPAKKQLYFDKKMYDYATCFAKESGERGYMGHEREKCEKGNFAENCSYGMQTAKDIVMQWLIDHNVADLGHRINCFGNYTKIGISVQPHKAWRTCAVADMIWGDITDENRAGATAINNANIPGNNPNNSGTKPASPVTANTTPAFNINRIVDAQGAKPVLRLKLNQYTAGKFYVFFGGSISYYSDQNAKLISVSKKEAPHYGAWNGLNWSWSFTLTSAKGGWEKYSVATNGDIYLLNESGSLVKAGEATSALE